MTTNETSRTQNVDNSIIAEWLKLEIFEEFGKYLYKVERYETHVRFAKTKKLIKLDFLNDRNQQKWVEDELEKKEYEIHYDYKDGMWTIFIQKNENSFSTYFHLIQTKTFNKSKNEAFIEAVLELIEKEENQ